MRTKIKIIDQIFKFLTLVGIIVGAIQPDLKTKPNLPSLAVI